MSGYRLPSGGLVDRGRALSFRFDGKDFRGFSGDSLASALLASGTTLFGRSFKYHRRRGVLGFGAEEPNALVTLREGARAEPNLKATTVELYDGLVAASQNRWPSLETDVMAVNSLMSKLFVAGFYYKTFKWPSAFWEKLYEPAIRRAAGLGEASGLPDPDAYDTLTSHCDVLVVGAGPAGLTAALAAARAGARVIVTVADTRPGGQLLAERHEVDGRPGADWAEGAWAELKALSNVTLLTRTSVFGSYDDGTFGAVEKVSDHLPVPPAGVVRQRLHVIVSRRSIVATGAVERPVVMAGNDLPGVMLASAVRGYAVRHGVACGRSVAIFTATDAGWRAAADLVASGVSVRAVIDPRAEVAPALAAALPGVPAYVGALVREAQGSKALSRIVIDKAGGASEVLDVDCLGLSAGFQPNVHLTGHLGGRPQWRDDLFAFGPGPLPKGMAVAGSAAGTTTLAACLADGAAAGAAAAESLGFTAPPMSVRRAEDEPSAVGRFWHVSGGRGKAFVDFQHDVTDGDVALAAREGYVSVEHLKRYTTLGMATDQGRTANLNGLAILAELTGRTIAETGLVLSRPPVEPVALGVLAGPHRGRHFRPVRQAPTNPVARARGAQMIEVGPWWRAQWYPLPGESDWLTSVSREVSAVRSGVGVTDMSTLGKIEVFGPDAAEFLSRVFASPVKRLKVGRCTYGLMLREDGFAFDDGTLARISETHYFTTCSTAHAAKVYEHFEFCRQVLFPELDVAIQTVSEQWATLAVAGPKAREALTRIVDPAFDLSNEGFPFLAFAETTVLSGIRARLYRLTFSGELAFELGVPSRQAAEVMTALLDRCADLRIVPYGTEAVGVMRIEKGHPAAAEFTGQVSAHTLGLGVFAERADPCVGRVLAKRSELVDPAKGRLVGLKPLEKDARLRAGAHLLPKGAPAEAVNDHGYVTSVAFSPTLGQWIGLGFLADGDSRKGQIVRVYDPVRGGDLLAEVVAPCFIDPQGTRARA